MNELTVCGPQDSCDVATWSLRLGEFIALRPGQHTSSGAEFASVAEAVAR